MQSYSIDTDELNESYEYSCRSDARFPWDDESEIGIGMGWLKMYGPQYDRQCEFHETSDETPTRETMYIMMDVSISDYENNVYGCSIFPATMCDDCFATHQMGYYDLTSQKKFRRVVPNPHVNLVIRKGTKRWNMQGKREKKKVFGKENTKNTTNTTNMTNVNSFAVLTSLRSQ